MSILELLRRLLVTGCLLVGVALVFLPGPVLIVAGVEDFARSQIENPFFGRPGGESLDEFVRRRTVGRVVTATDGDSTRFIQSLLAGQPDAALQQIAQGHARHWVFKPDALPRAVADAQQKGVWYLSDAQAGSWVRLESRPATDIEGLDRRWRHPWRTYGLAALPVALLLYWAIPRQAHKADCMVYDRLSAVFIPDWLGFMGMCFFESLYLFVHQWNLPGEPVPSLGDGWWILLATFSLLVAGFFLIVLTGFRYATLSLCITDDALEVHHWRGTHRYLWARMQSCAPYVSNRGGRLGALLMMLAPGPGAFGQGRLLAGNEEWGVEIQMHEGRRIRVMGNAFPGLTQIVGELQRRAVAGSSALQQIQT